MEKRIFCVDLDDTISDTAPEILKYAIKFDIEHLGRSGTLTEITNCHDCFYFAYMLSWGREEVKDFFDTYYLEFLQSVSLRRGAKETLEKLRDLNMLIHVVTARHEKQDGMVKKISHDWLAENNVPYDHLLVNCLDKANYVKEVNGLLFLDDSLQNCASVKENTSAHSFLMETRHNLDYSNLEIPRVTWDEFYRHAKVLRRLP